MKKIYDITTPIRNGMLTYPGDPGVNLRRVHIIGAGSSANLSEYCFGSHTGTHVDPPLHFYPEGGGVDTLPLDALIGRAVVISVPGDEITAGFLEKELPEGAERVLFKTKNSGLLNDPVFHKDFAHLAADAATYLVGRGVRLVGIDYLSVEVFHSPDHAVHKTLLGAGVVIVEGLELSGVRPGEYRLTCLPLLVEGGDGAPARAILEEL